MDPKVMDKIVSLAKRRGFVFPSSQVYGGLESCWDYGPLGARLKANIKAHWMHAMTRLHGDVVPLDSSILMHPRIWEASGHVEEFTDPLVDCKKCKSRFRADEFKEVPGPETACPNCGTRGELTEPREFNLMFKTFMGPVEDDTARVFLRPETAQGIYVNFHNVQQSSRQKVPFGIAQIGKAFRNEITTKNFVFRTREFEQMEMQFFVKPGTDEEWFDKWKDERVAWYREIGIREENLRLHPHGEGELAHYAKAAIDIEFQFPFGWKELEGIHNRTDFDLGRHQEYSGKSLEYFDDQTREKYIPYVVETSAGCDRTLLVVLCDAYREEEVTTDKGTESRVVLRIDPRLAPIKAAVLPLVKRDGMPEKARALTAELRRSFDVLYDESAAVGRRYRRQDEIGTPFCVTVDSESLENDTVTVRNRDDMEQVRLPCPEVEPYIREKVRF